MDAARLVTWDGIDPTRVDAAQVMLAGDTLLAQGASVTPEYVLDYRIATGASWITRELSVGVRGDGWSRALELRRVDDGVWSARWIRDNDVSDADHIDGLDAALDCDLGLCPLTNTMPIRRHDLLVKANHGDRDWIEIVVAWVSVPDLAVHAQRQQYRAAWPVDPSGAVVEFRSDDFGTAIEVDELGLVVSYPGLAHRRAR